MGISRVQKISSKDETRQPLRAGPAHEGICQQEKPSILARRIEGFSDNKEKDKSTTVYH
jgi:hypothetical protein